jgi:hypothetical protein
MSTLQIQAELENTEPFFIFAGKDLQRPLEDLREYLLAQAKKYAAELGPEASREVPTLGGLIKPGPETELKQKIRLALNDAFEAQLWAAECKRCPDQVWRLNMSRLKWVYRQTAPGVT